MLRNIGMTELLLVAGVALLVFGPKKLPDLGKSIGQAIREFKKSTDAVTEEVKEVAEAAKPGKV